MKRTLLFFFWTILLSSCITIEDEPNTIVYQYIIWNGDTIKCDTLNYIKYGN